jgi:hypothetical protein
VENKGQKTTKIAASGICQGFACGNALSTGLAAFAARNTPTMGDLIDHTQNRYTGIKGQALHKTLVTPALTLVHTNLEACTSVQRDYATTEGSGVYGGILRDKLNNVVWLMYANFSSLGMFALGPSCHKKVRRLNKPIQEYGVNLLAG